MKDKRLLVCAQLCKGNFVVDVGTDHGHLVEYLITEGICERCIACDVNEKPLMSAKKTICDAGIEEKAEVILSDGLDEISPNGVTDIVIAGMGGELIVDILSRAEWIKENKVNLVLQPMTKWDTLRKWLYDNKFEISNEIACKDGKFVYSVMQACYTGRMPEYSCDMKYLYTGRINPNTDDSVAYIERQAVRMETVAKGMLNNPSKKDQADIMLKTVEDLRMITNIN